MSGGTRYQPEQLVNRLRLIEVAVANGKTTAQACKEEESRRIATGACREVGKDRVERIWRRVGLKAPKRQKPRGRLRLSDGWPMLWG